jgi:RNase P/RNase MRP subunit p29
MSKGRFKNLEDAFGLESMHSVDEDLVQEQPASEETPSPEQVSKALSQAKDLEKQFKSLDGYDLHDREMDELAKMAIEAHQNLQDLGMNVEIRHAGEIFSSSSQMLKIAVDARNSKVDKKLKLLKLQMDKLKMDRSFKEGEAVEGTAFKLDRNELLKQLKNMGKDSDD